MTATELWLILNSIALVVCLIGLGYSMGRERKG